LHHYLLDAGCTHSQAVAIIVGTNIACMLAAYLMQDMNPIVVLGCCTAINVVVLFLVLQVRKKIMGRA
jgi:hypothetical protein